ncbi:hypothetical protein NSK_006270 [Nannochloropsis salina CCMP1776]|uniref:Uncharacterized protein n=1 Tax=Nannochloropsis salina CCMP1776 TaxID=1027361 RepID=A0A4D9CV35_9STRA|nr:hypothetical protein NSK_006270 [Nannochloropsis salina CCMP1776]|eukprot:TFJ82444.1 hypothetical protein NSK_006270 [Nannochloropsis salina CCMP1776]
MSVEEIFQLIQCRGSVTQEKKEVDLGRLRVLLSQNKALVQAKGRMDEETPLHVAAAEGVLEAVRLLLQAGASPAAVDKAGYTPLHWAAGKGHEKVVEELLKHNADANATDKNGLTPLHRAAYWGQTACIKELLYKGGADANVQDHLQHTPFMMAAWFGKIDSAREIFEKMKSNDIQLPNVWGLTPLEWARQSNRSEVAAFIERRYRKLGLPIERVQPGSSNRSSVPPSPSPSHSAAISPFVGSSTPTTATLGGASSQGEGGRASSPSGQRDGREERPGSQKLAAVVAGGSIWTSTNSGVSWIERTDAGSRQWQSIASSSNGTKLAAVVIPGYIYTSTDAGVSWTERLDDDSRVWRSIASSSDGTKLAAVETTTQSGTRGSIWTSTNSGVSWMEQTDAGQSYWASIASSSDGTKLAAVVFGGDIFASTDSGSSWTDYSAFGDRSWVDCVLVGWHVVFLGSIWTSIDAGVTWTEQTGAGSAQWQSIASSSDGTKLAAVVNPGFIWTYA